MHLNPRLQPQPEPPPRDPSWLNPRLALHVNRLIEHLAWHGGRVRFDSTAYASMRNDHRLERFQVDAAIDAAWALGIVEMHLSGSEVQTITLLADDIHAA